MLNNTATLLSLQYQGEKKQPLVMDTALLQPCPFCQGKAQVVTFTSVTYLGEVNVSYAVRCSICGASPSMLFPCDSEVGATAAWNKRF